jgi:hypothetical protein
MTTWKLQAGRVYVSADGNYMIKNVGYKSWGLCVNDGSPDWDIDWIGSCYPTAKAAMDSIKAVAK